MIEAEITQDEEANAIYISVQRGTDIVAKTRTIPTTVLIDLDKDDNIIGIEILGIDRPIASYGP